MSKQVERFGVELVRGFVELGPDEWPAAGGKGATLARLYRAGYPVPEGFVVLPAAFEGDQLRPCAWRQVQAQLARLRSRDPGGAFAVRSSALGEDSDQASFAGEFETVLDVRADDEVREAIATVRRSALAERVRAYGEAQGVGVPRGMAVVVQRLVRAELAGVLFTADPVTGDRATLVGNYVRGLGEGVVSGEAEAATFTLARPKGEYRGPAELRRFAGELYWLGNRLERHLGSPQDVEWAIARGKVYLLQARPITTLRAANPATGEWNDSLTGDYLWTSTNFTEAIPDVMTPLTWSLWQIFHSETLTARLPGNWPLAGNICGRTYLNMTLVVSLYCATGLKLADAIRRVEAAGGRVPAGVEIRPVPAFSLLGLLAALPDNLRLEAHAWRVARRAPEFVAGAPARCRALQQRIQAALTGAELASLWRAEVRPYVLDAFWMLRVAMRRFEAQAGKLHGELAALVGAADAEALLSSFSGDGDLLASLGPVAGLARVARGELSREEYLAAYGHRGPHELELSLPRPAEDPSWLDEQLAELARSPVDVDGLLARRRRESEAARARLAQRHPEKASALRRRLDEVAALARTREAVRSEATRVTGLARDFALRAGEVTGLGDGIFYLSLDELLAALAGDRAVAATIPARRETHARYQALPAYPAAINGRFDPFRWAADPDRRGDLFDAHATRPPAPDADVIAGFPGAAGRVEGRVRRLERPEDGAELQPGEVLVAATTNVGWTPLFPRAAAIVTDVGAPLSHAAIVARELGIPAVVGCGSATTRLRTGDLVRVDGGHGTVEVVMPSQGTGPAGHELVFEARGPSPTRGCGNSS